MPVTFCMYIVKKFRGIENFISNRDGHVSVIITLARHPKFKR